MRNKDHVNWKLSGLINLFNQKREIQPIIARKKNYMSLMEYNTFINIMIIFLRTFYFWFGKMRYVCEQSVFL